MKKILSIVILFSMVLHCASRLGILSQVYQKRHSIAYTVGLIAEIPIALCGSDYDPSDKLYVQSEDAGEALPANFTQAQEINLFIVNGELSVMPGWLLIATDDPCRYHGSLYPSPSFRIFHPPSKG
jgi:hypothetical protein